MIIMTSNEVIPIGKRGNETPKKSSPLKVVSPIIRKYSGQRKGRIKKKLKFPRILHGISGKQGKQLKPQLKTILPKFNAGDVIILEPELLPCALNLNSKMKDESEVLNESATEQVPDNEEKLLGSPTTKENSSGPKPNKSKLIVTNTKKKMKYFKNIEATLDLLVPELIASKDKREEIFAENYLFKIQQRLEGKDEALYNQFIDLICDFEANGITVVELYKKIRQMLSSYSDLSEDFIAFLTRAQAVKCGVFMEHLLLTTMTEFLTMIDIYFSKSPHQIKKIHSILESLANKHNITVDDVTSAILPLLKGNSVLTDYFLQILPDCRPPENFVIDYEKIDYPELNSDVSDDEDVFETIQVPEVEDVFGGDNCPCSCHETEDEKFKTRVHHCTPCLTKFINGKIFIQCGKFLRPAKIVFEDHDIAYHRDRLVPKLYPKRGRKRNRSAVFKENLSPTKSCTLSSDEFKSDIEEDERGRSKGNVKSPRISRKKSVSPKSCDKNIPKSLFNNESKTDCTDSDVKIPTFSLIYDDILQKSPEVDKLFDNDKDEQNNHITSTNIFESSTEEIKIEDPNKSLDLPEIGEVKFTPKTELSENLALGENNNSPVVITKEGSKSPPVISIPDSAIPLFSSAKPILSLLENLDETKDGKVAGNSKKYSASCSNSLPNLDDDVKEEVEEEDSDPPWKIEEDRIILQTLQVEESCDETFFKISSKIPNRKVEDIKKRFDTLMHMLYEMKAKTANG